MQISRHWRMNSQRYRLQGVRYTDGNVSLQARPAYHSTDLTSDKGTEAEFHRIEHANSSLSAASVA